MMPSRIRRERTITIAARRVPLSNLFLKEGFAFSTPERVTGIDFLLLYISVNSLSMFSCVRTDDAEDLVGVLR